MPHNSKANVILLTTDKQAGGNFCAKLRMEDISIKAEQAEKRLSKCYSFSIHTLNKHTRLLKTSTHEYTQKHTRLYTYTCTCTEHTFNPFKFTNIDMYFTKT